MDLLQFAKSNFGSLPKDKNIQQTFIGSTVSYNGETVAVNSIIYDTNLPARFLLILDIVHDLTVCIRTDIFTGKNSKYKPTGKVLDEFEKALKKASDSFNKYSNLINKGEVIILGYKEPKILKKEKALADYKEAMFACGGSEGDRMKNTYSCLDSGDNIVDDYADCY